MGTKVKITKQELKQDKFTTSMLKARGWLEDNWQVVAVVAAAVLIVIIGAVYYKSHQSSREGEGIQKYSQALNQLQTRNYQPAIIGFNDIIDNYSGDVVARAQFNLGNAYFESRNYQEAIAAYQRYIDKFHLDPLTTSSAVAGIAASLESQQNFADAAEKYLSAIDRYPDTPARPDYLLGAIRCFVQLGEKDKIKTQLDILEKDYPGSDQYLTAYQLYMR